MAIGNAKAFTSCKRKPANGKPTKREDRITLHIRNCHKGKLGFEYRTEMEYTVNADGSIMVNSVIMPVSDGEIIPRVGYRMELPEGFERMRWYGRGPWENYTDRKDATPIGVYESTVSDQWVDYVKPQEMGNHEEVRWISITNADGMGFVFVAGGQWRLPPCMSERKTWQTPTICKN